MSTARDFRTESVGLRETTYSVKVLRSGQPRPYADTEREYLITVKSTMHGKDGLHPWLMYGDVESRIKQEEKWRAEGRMSGGETPEQLRAGQREWAKSIVRALCQNFREANDDDGRTGMTAHFYPTLKTLKIDPAAGTIHVFIVEPYTD